MLKMQQRKIINLIFIVIIELLSATAINEDQIVFGDQQLNVAASCTTPNKDVGVCVEVRKCSIFVDAIRSGKDGTYDFIRKSQCGASNAQLGQLRVCCGKFDNYLYENIPKRSLFPKNCGIQDSQSRITSGIQAQLGEYPWMARLRHRRNDSLLSYGCSAFLISEQFVLTAAHCIRSKQLVALGPIYQVLLGEHNTETDPDCTNLTGEASECADRAQWLIAEEPIVHPGYTADIQLHNDIAIIPLKEPAKFTAYVAPICLPETLSEQPYMAVSGWGKTETDQSSSVKLSVNIPRADKTLCTNLYKNIGITILESQFCAGGQAGRDACSGDSGGPIMVATAHNNDVAWFAEGIISFGKGCGLEKWPGIYTSIPYYMAWIKTAIGQYLNDHKKQHKVQQEEEAQEFTSLCTTPNGEKAHCVSIYNCTILRNVLGSRNLTSENIRFLKESQCGYDNEPHVCCGSASGFQNGINESLGRENVLTDPNSCGLQNVDRLSRGTQTGFGEFPWMVLLKYGEKGNETTFSCGGALINNKYVLTAAQCVTGQITQKLGPLVSVRLGEWDISRKKDCIRINEYEDCIDPPVDVGIDEIVAHPDYDDASINKYHDIALLRLDRKIEFTDFIRPICLPTPSDSAPTEDHMLWVSGWGLVEYANSSSIKHKAAVDTVTNNNCNNFFASGGIIISDSQICASREITKDLCCGDNGGPLMREKSYSQQWLLEGVMSSGTPCVTKTGIYTRVSQYLDWIYDNVRL